MHFSYRELDFECVIIYKKIKGVYLRFKNNACIITSGVFLDDEEISKILISNYDYILKRFKKMSNHEKRLKNDFTEFLLWGKRYDIVFNDRNQSTEITEDKIILNLSSPALMQIKKALKELYIKETSRYLKTNSTHLEEAFNLKPSPAYEIKYLKSAFGICLINQKIIKINYYLAAFDEKYLKSVILHELAHFFVANHQKEFYDCLTKVSPDCKRLNKELKKLYLELPLLE